MKARVLVTPKQGILDPQGQAVESSLRHLVCSVGEPRIGRVVELEVEAKDAISAQAEVERMCEQLLANPLIERYERELAAQGPARSHASACCAFRAPATTVTRSGRFARSTRRRS